MGVLQHARLLPIALRSLARNRRRTALTLAALALGVMAAVGVRGFLNGLQESLILGVVEGGHGALQIHKKGFLKSTETVPLTPAISESEELYRRIRETEGVKELVPRISFAGMVNASDESPFAILVGTDPARELEVSPRRNDALVSGRWLLGESDLLLGMELASGLDVSASDDVVAKDGAAAADKVALIANDKDGVLNAVEGPVVGTLAALTQGEKRLVLLPLEKAQELLRMEGQVTEIAVALHDVDDASEVKARLEQTLGDEYEVHTWQELVPLVSDVRQIQNAVLDIVIGVFLFIILMGVTNTMLMNVLERVREIGTMLSLGARRRQVLQLFVLEAAVLGGLGATLGALAGALLVFVLGIFGVSIRTPGSSLPQLIIPTIGPSFLAGMVLLGVVGASLSALYPAWRASRMSPASALSKA